MKVAQLGRWCRRQSRKWGPQSVKISQHWRSQRLLWGKEHKQWSCSSVVQSLSMVWGCRFTGKQRFMLWSTIMHLPQPSQHSHYQNLCLEIWRRVALATSFAGRGLSSREQRASFKGLYLKCSQSVTSSKCHCHNIYFSNYSFLLRHKRQII